MFTFITRILITLALCAFSFAAAAPTPKTGSFELTFSERSPLSDVKTIAKRFGVKDAVENYDLSKESCFVFVPPTYAPAKPIGLVVLLNYKVSDRLPESALPQFGDANLALVVPKNDGMPMIARAGLALDIAHNMKKQYAIDPRRIYVFGFDRDSTAERLGLNFADVFTGTFSQFYEIYRTVKSSTGGMWAPKLPRPDAKSFALAKAHPFVLSSIDGGDQWERWAGSFKSDGFKHVKSMTLTLEQYHYPAYTSDWLPDVIKFMDDATAKLDAPSAQTRPATKPATRATSRPTTRATTRPTTRPGTK